MVVSELSAMRSYGGKVCPWISTGTRLLSLKTPIIYSPAVVRNAEPFRWPLPTIGDGGVVRNAELRSALGADMGGVDVDKLLSIVGAPPLVRNVELRSVRKGEHRLFYSTLINHISAGQRNVGKGFYNVRIRTPFPT